MSRKQFVATNKLVRNTINNYAKRCKRAGRVVYMTDVWIVDGSFVNGDLHNISDSV